MTTLIKRIKRSCNKLHQTTRPKIQRRVKKLGLMIFFVGMIDNVLKVDFKNQQLTSPLPVVSWD